MNETQVFIVNAFTDALFGGNPAAVVPVESAMSDELMQSIAAQHNLSETAFPECLGPDRFNLRWFTPQKEVPLCGHATLATAYTLDYRGDWQGETLTFTVTASDPNGDNVTVTAIGGPFEDFEPDAGFGWNPLTDVGTFSWTPGCDAVRQAPYQVVFKATDADAVPLSDVETVQIRVLPRPVAATSAQPIGNAVEVDWIVHPCTDQYSEAMQALGGYEVHRRIGSGDIQETTCGVGMPAGSGYTLVATVQGLGNNAYLDTETLSYGATYCYRIVAVMPDGSRSRVGPEACAEIDKGIPVMTGASVEVSDAASGEVEVRWSPPTDADTVEAFPGPYRYAVEARPDAGADC